jgi:hypothetical protein
LVNDSRLCDVPRTITLRPSHGTSESKQLSTRKSATLSSELTTTAELTTTLSAELEGRVPTGLIDEIVRAVLDERRHVAKDRAVEATMIEARQRIERFIRARSAR